MEAPQLKDFFLPNAPENGYCCTKQGLRVLCVKSMRNQESRLPPSARRPDATHPRFDRQGQDPAGPTGLNVLKGVWSIASFGPHDNAK